MPRVDGGRELHVAISTTVVPPRKKARATHSKVRTGCRTCKIRKLKCDETKPSCLRCLKFSGHCDGYGNGYPSSSSEDSSPTASQNVSTSQTHRLLLPRANKQKRITETPVLHRGFHVAKFRNEQEHLGFLAFKNLTISELSSFFPSSLWERVIFQACEEEVFIRDAVIAVGSLFSCERRFILDSENRKTWGALENAPRHQFALRHYGKAIQTMRKKLSSTHGERGLRTMLIGCLLIVCFEAVQGNYVQSLRHAVSGHGVMQSWLTSRKRSSPRNEGFESPSDAVVETELVQAFARMDLQVMQYSVDPRTIEQHQTLALEGSETIENMPSVFTNVDEARLYLDLIQRRAWHFIATVWLEQYKKQGEGDQLVVSEHAHMATRSEEQNSVHQRREAESKAHLSEVLHWIPAMQPLYDSITRGSREWKALDLLQIQAHTTKVLLHGWLRLDESWSDPFLRDFKWIINKARGILDEDSIQNAHRFSFDGGIIHPLRTVGSDCRDPTVRREAIALLRKIAVKELFWDGLMHASVCEAQMKFEEEGLDGNGYIPESRRFKIIGGKVDMLNRIGTVIFVRMGRNEDGSLDQREFTLPM